MSSLSRMDNSPEFRHLEFKKMEDEWGGADLAVRLWSIRSLARMAKLADAADLKSSMSQ